MYQRKGSKEMRTSYYARMNSKKFEHLKDKGVQISQSARYWNGKKYPPLYPSWELIGINDREEYERRYKEEVLSKLDPLEVYSDLGEDAILLCHESIAKIESGEEFCHRHMVAKWLEEELLNQYGIAAKILELTEENDIKNKLKQMKFKF